MAAIIGVQPIIQSATFPRLSEQKISKKRHFKERKLNKTPFVFKTAAILRSLKAYKNKCQKIELYNVRTMPNYAQ